jgi:flagellar biosynthetic protein FlhB
MAEDADESEKTEDPTAKRLQKARSDGNIAKSRELDSFMLLLLAVIIFTVLGPWVAVKIMMEVRVYFADIADIPSDIVSFGLLLKETLINSMLYSAVIILPLVVAYLVSSISQNGLVWAPGTITKIQLSRLSPLKGLQKYIQAQQWVEFIKGLIKIAIVCVTGYVILAPQLDKILAVIHLPISNLFDEMLILLIQVIVALIIIMGIIAIADLLFQRFNHQKKLRMTRKEVKDEHKEREGNPEIKRRLMQIRMERYRNMLVQVIPESDVVITNPTHFAVVLKYDQFSHEAPVVTAKGQDHMAMLIRKIANEHDVPIIENPPLARALYDLVEVGQEIFEDHYQAVAEIIRYVYDLKNKKLAA